MHVCICLYVCVWYSGTVKSRDRTEPAVGAFVIRELYYTYNDVWLVELLFDDVLDWNTFLWNNRRLSPYGLMALGSNPYTPIQVCMYVCIVTFVSCTRHSLSQLLLHSSVALSLTHSLAIIGICSSVPTPSIHTHRVAMSTNSKVPVMHPALTTHQYMTFH